MSEHLRTETHHFVDVTRYTIIDSGTGETVRFGPNWQALGTLEQALAMVAGNHGWEDRWMIVKVEGIRGYELPLDEACQ